MIPHGRPHFPCTNNTMACSLLLRSLTAMFNSVGNVLALLMDKLTSLYHSSHIYVYLSAVCVPSERASPPQRNRSRSRSSDGQSDEFGRLHICNFDESMKEADLEDAFKKFGNIHSVWLASYPPLFAFVTFKHKDDAAEALKQMDNAYVGRNKIKVATAHPPRKPGERRPRRFGGGGGGRGGGYGGGYGGGVTKVVVMVAEDTVVVVEEAVDTVVVVEAAEVTVVVVVDTVMVVAEAITVVVVVEEVVEEEAVEETAAVEVVDVTEIVIEKVARMKASCLVEVHCWEGAFSSILEGFCSQGGWFKVHV
ncbi:unnamed protein product [Anisakis simplex]|uniref:RRM domain-containing protein n=1 Tax=Anisakis simplex TaxID=6269 RepID=A0A0M3K8T4_ANISI|nr:unnamed protein product [Anisakis simplex]